MVDPSRDPRDLRDPQLPLKPDDQLKTDIKYAKYITGGTKVLQIFLSVCTAVAVSSAYWRHCWEAEHIFRTLQIFAIANCVITSVLCLAIICMVDEMVSLLFWNFAEIIYNFFAAFMLMLASALVCKTTYNWNPGCRYEGFIGAYIFGFIAMAVHLLDALFAIRKWYMDKYHEQTYAVDY